MLQPSLRAPDLSRVFRPGSHRAGAGDRLVRAKLRLRVVPALVASALALGAFPASRSGEPAPAAPMANDPVARLVTRLDLERYKATIKGLTRFGDRRQGTDRNRAAVDWIEAQLKSYGCANISRLKYTFFPNEAPHPSGPSVGAGRSVGGARNRGVKAPTGVNVDPKLQPDEKLRALNSQP